MMNMISSPDAIKSFSNQEDLNQNLACIIAAILETSLKKREEACLIVSGGSTPKPLFSTLSQIKIDWNNVSTTLADERWVSTSDKDSNENMVRKYLLQNQAASAQFTGLKTNDKTAQEAEQLCEQRFQSLPRADLLILGLGNDGHTASLFPGAPQLSTALDLNSNRTCMAMRPASTPQERMTLTLPALLLSRQIILHITGDKKLEVLHKAFSDGPVQEMPIRAILRNSLIPVSIFWAP